jgi:3-epi-6-deoxocathasterone 23-monooxygenase
MIISFIRATLFVFEKDLLCFVATCCRYGKVFKSHIFGSPTIVSTDADVNEFILQSVAKVFVPSYPKSLMELMGESSILLINGTLQRRIHGLIGAFFKSQQLKILITKDIHKYVRESMENWKEDQPIYIQDETKKVTSISFPSLSL